MIQAVRGGEKKENVKHSQAANLRQEHGHTRRKGLSHLSVERLFARQLVLQFVLYVMERRRLPLGTQVSAKRERGGEQSTRWEVRGRLSVRGGEGGNTNLRSNVVILSSMSSL